MKAIHILSTLPSIDGFHPLFFEIAAMSLSAILWKKYNGEICLYTDDCFYKFINDNDLVTLWDSIDHSLFRSLPTTIDWSIFWAGAKHFALRNEKAPIVLLDHDLFVWKDIRDIYKGHQLITLHREDLFDCYLPKNKLSVADDYTYPDGLDWSIRPCNTAFAYFARNEFKDLYVREAIRFMDGNTLKANDGNARMVFAEQRLLAMLARREGLDIETIIGDPFAVNNKVFTHLWGAKILAKRDPKQRMRLEDAILKKIKALSLRTYNQLSDLRHYLPDHRSRNHGAQP